ncbi:hypothetical protein Ancab_026811 [Ancistrocladus abbreviatus]
METTVQETTVIIVGAGPSGLTVSACLFAKQIPHIVIEREDCCAPLWKRRTYNCLHLHLAKEYCHLPFQPHPPVAATYIPRDEFIKYLDEYASEFKIEPHYCHNVEAALYDEAEQRWVLTARNTEEDQIKHYKSKFLVVATGENNRGKFPNDIPGLQDFMDRSLHSSEYRKGLEFEGKNVLVVGCGNSGMEISLDLSNYGAMTWIVIRNPVHVFPREFIHAGMYLLKYLQVSTVDSLLNSAAKLYYGDLSRHGIERPSEGPFALKLKTGRSLVIDVGAVSKIKAGEIKVLSTISTIKENSVLFANGVENSFDAIIFATGYESTACQWLRDYRGILKDNGMPENPAPTHWKGKNGAHCVGLSRMGIAGIRRDAQVIAQDIADKVNAFASKQILI